jgi:hypothetical protein
MIYKVSYVISGGSHPGAIVNRDTPPRLGETVELGKERFEVVEVTDLIPPQGDLAFLHVTLQPVRKIRLRRRKPRSKRGRRRKD